MELIGGSKPCGERVTAFPGLLRLTVNPLLLVLIQVVRQSVYNRGGLC